LATFKGKTYDLFALFLPKSVSEDKNLKRAQKWKNRSLKTNYFLGKGLDPLEF